MNKQLIKSRPDLTKAGKLSQIHALLNTPGAHPTRTPNQTARRLRGPEQTAQRCAHSKPGGPTWPSDPRFSPTCLGCLHREPCSSQGPICSLALAGSWLRTLLARRSPQSRPPRGPNQSPDNTGPVSQPRLNRGHARDHPTVPRQQHPIPWTQSPGGSLILNRRTVAASPAGAEYSRRVTVSAKRPCAVWGGNHSLRHADTNINQQGPWGIRVTWHHQRKLIKPQ